MKKYLIALCLFATACTNSGNQAKSPTDTEENIPETEVSISKMQALNGDISADADTIDLQSIPGSRILQKRIRIKNNTAAQKDVSVKVLQNPTMSISVNRCGISLDAGKTCTLILSQNIRKSPNGDTPGFLQIVDESNPQGVVVNSHITDSTYVAPTVDGVLASDVSVSFSNFDDYSSGSLRRKIVVSNDSPSKSVIDISYAIPSGYRIVLSRCGATLEYKKSCDIFLDFLGGNGTPNVDDELVITSGASVKRLELITKPVVSGISLDSSKKFFTITGLHFSRIKSAKLVKESGEVIAELNIESPRVDSTLQLKPKADLQITGGKYKFRLE